MGSINFSIREYFDAVTETVGMKSGLLLTNIEATKILNQTFPESFFNNPNLDDGIRIRSEELDDHIRCIRVSIGNLKDARPLFVSQALGPWIKGGYNVIKVMELFVELHSLHKSKELEPDFIISHIQEKMDVPEDLVVAVGSFFAEHQFRSSYVAPQQKDWDGITPLENLFSCELKGKGKFLEQGFLDYLAANSEALEYIHWRNFERLCAEFFQRQGYEMVLGPGSNDGGVDIRAFSKEDSIQPLFLVQCKRHKKENKVDIPTVKAFYTDVDEENAKYGIIATTSYISTGGQKIAQARNYPLSFAENEDIKKWAQSMWRYSK